MFPKLSERRERCLVDYEYRYWLPLTAHLPLVAGEALANLRGRCNHQLVRDWRRFLGDLEVQDRTLAAYRLIAPSATEAQYHAWLSERYRVAAREEWEARLLVANRTGELHASYSGHEPVESWIAGGGKIVFLTAHFDSSIMGAAFLGRRGWTVSPMSSNVVDRPDVPRAISVHYRRKYEGITRLMNGGRVMDAETHLRAFFAAIAAGEMALVLGDLPAARADDACRAEFFGRERAFAPGATRLAERTGAALVAYLCLREGTGRYHVRFSPLCVSQTGAWYAPAYRFLEESIREYPGRWWAADTLPLFALC